VNIFILSRIFHPGKMFVFETGQLTNPRYIISFPTKRHWINRYLSGLLDPFVTLLEVHKLMYFKQEAGQPLNLKYQKALY
jgi:hypothetical protein